MSLHYAENGDLFIGTVSSLTKRTCEYCTNDISVSGKYHRYNNNLIPKVKNVRFIETVQMSDAPKPADFKTDNIAIFIGVENGVSVFNPDDNECTVV